MMLLVCSASHFHCFLERLVNCDDRFESRPTQRNGHWLDDHGVADRVCARHFLTSMGSETTLGCLAADRAAVECPEYLSSRCRSMMKVGKMHIPPTVLGPASGLSAVLGRDALDSRATAIEPDVVDVIRKRRNVKERGGLPRSQASDTHVS